MKKEKTETYITYKGEQIKLRITLDSVIKVEELTGQAFTELLDVEKYEKGEGGQFKSLALLAWSGIGHVSEDDFEEFKQNVEVSQLQELAEAVSSAF